MLATYGQYCALARALDLIGARWTLLIVRNLVGGPKRFSELQEGLPGIPTNLLASRLRDLEEAGIVERILRERGSSAVVYRLSPLGVELEPALVALALWGAKSLGEPEKDAFYSIDGLNLALRAAFQSEKASRHPRLYELRIGEGRLLVSVSEGRVSFPPTPPFETSVVIEADPPAAFFDVFRRKVKVEAAIASGRLRVTGSEREARRFFEMFSVPALGS
jgi:DNA-binding HxlR family transcriptional regulator